MEDNLAKQDQSASLISVVRWFEAAEDASREARATSEKCRDYYDGEQYTDEEKATLRKRKQPIITVNRIKPKINTLKGMQSQSRSAPKALPRNQDHDQEAANAAQDAIRYVLDDQSFKNIEEECFENLAIEGTMGIEVNVTPKGQDFAITLRRIHWDRLFYDPHSRNKDFSDAKYYGELVWLDLEDAAEQYPDAKEVISATMESFGKGDTYSDKPTHRWADATRRRVCLISMAYLKSGQWMHCVFVRGGFLQAPASLPFQDEDGNSESLYLLQSAYVDRDGQRYGPVKDWLSLQDEINKRRSKALHIMSVRQAKVAKGGVDSIAALRNELAKPDGVIEENIQGSVEVLPMGDMAAAQFQLLAEAKSEIDGVGVNAALSGTETRVMSGRALEARSNAGSAEMRPIMDVHSHFKHRIYRAIWSRIRQYWTEEKWVRVTDEQKNSKFVGLNKPLTRMDSIIKNAEKQGQPLNEQELQTIRAMPQMNEVVGRENAPADLDVDIILDEVPDFAALQSEQFAELSDLAKAGMPIPPEAIIEASSLRNKEKILKMMKGETDDQPSPELMQAQQKVQQAEKIIGDMQEALDTAEDKHTVAMTDATTRRMKVEADIAANLAETRQTGSEIAELRQMVAALIQMSGIPQMGESDEAPMQPPELPMPGAMEPMQAMPEEMMQMQPEGPQQ
jgi:hypothetical protein